MPENHTIPDPHLTREEAEALCGRRIELFVMHGFHGREKLRNSLSAPLVEDGGVEEGRRAVDALAAVLYEEQKTYSQPGWDAPEPPSGRGYLTPGLREMWRGRARIYLAAIQPFLGQGELTEVEKWKITSDAHCSVLMRAEDAGLRRFEGLDAGDQAEEVCRLLSEFDAWLSFHPEFKEVLTAFRSAFKTDTSAAAPTQQHKEEEKV